jgi:hypothetical protein
VVSLPDFPRLVRVLRRALDEHLPGIDWPDLPVVGVEWGRGEGHSGVVFYPVATPSSGQLDDGIVSRIARLRGRSGAVFTQEVWGMRVLYPRVSCRRRPTRPSWCQGVARWLVLVSLRAGSRWEAPVACPQASAVIQVSGR